MAATCLDDVFVRHVLLCIDEHKLTAEEIHLKYKNKYPPAFDFLKKILPPVAINKVEMALKMLLKEEYLLMETTWYTDQALSLDTKIYHISPLGRGIILKKKR